MNEGKAEKISSKFSNCAITRQKKLTDFTRKRNRIPFDVCVCVSLCVNKLNKCRVAFCLTAVFLWYILDRILDTAEHCQSKELKPNKRKLSMCLFKQHLPTTFCNIWTSNLATLCVSCSFQSFSSILSLLFPLKIYDIRSYSSCMHLKICIYSYKTSYFVYVLEKLLLSKWNGNGGKSFPISQ